LLGAAHYPVRFRGKGTWPRDAGFGHTCLWQVDQLGSRFWGPLLYVDGQNRQFEEDDYGPDIVTKYITDFMSDHRAVPLFIYYPMILVHSPFVPTPGSASRQSKDRQRNFEDMVRQMDTLVGRIVRKTEELGIAERTLILFTADNGTHKSIRSTLDGRDLQGGKGRTTDAGTRVPLIAHWPGVIPAGRVSDDLVDFSDFLPTLLEAAGATAPDGLDGRSFLPQLRGGAGNPREWIYCYYCPRPQRTPPIRFVRDQRWKLYGDGRLFDIANDPAEKDPLESVEAGTPADAARRKLEAALRSMPAEGVTLLEFGPNAE
jgi:arylsulfatase A-like enzyme